MKLPRNLSGADIVKALRRHGFHPVRQKGSHIQMVKDERRVTVPAHGFVAVGTLQNILRQAGLTVDEFIETL